MENKIIRKLTIQNLLLLSVIICEILALVIGFANGDIKWEYPDSYSICADALCPKSCTKEKLCKCKYQDMNGDYIDVKCYVNKKGKQNE